MQSLRKAIAKFIAILAAELLKVISEKMSPKRTPENYQSRSISVSM